MRLAVASAAASVILASGASSLAAPEDAGRTAEVAAGAGFLYRRATTDRGVNPGGISYGGSIGYDVQARVFIVPWLRGTAYYLRGYEKISIPNGASSILYDHLQIDDALAYSLGARVEPTWHISDRFRAWGILGAGWGRMQAPKMTVQTAGRSYTVKPRAGVFVEFPLGLGAAVDVLPGRLAVSFESTAAAHSSQSGDLFAIVQYVDDRGEMGHVEAMPRLSLTLANMLHLVLQL